MRDHQVTLTVNGNRFAGWKEATVIQGIEQMSGGFELGISDRWPAQHSRWQIRPGDECAVDVDGHRLVTGYVDEVTTDFDKESHSIKVKGRDKTGDLIDSSIEPNREWEEITLSDIATEVAAPYGVRVIDEAPADKLFKKVSVEEGETPFELFERLARQQGVLLTSDGFGALVITRTGVRESGATLTEGKNILKASGVFNDSDRFSKYITKGQRPGDDLEWGRDVSQVISESHDPNIKRYRPLVLVAEENSTIESLTLRADWESTVRAGRSQKATITVADWYHNGNLWTANTLVNVVSPSLGLSAHMLIASVRFIINEQSGILTELAITLPDAYKPEPMIPSSERGSGLWDMDAVAGLGGDYE